VESQSRSLVIMRLVRLCLAFLVATAALVLSGAGNLTFSGSTALNLSFDGAGSVVDSSDAF